jgi:hypothetical protein
MIFGIRTYELPDYRNKSLKFYWGALNRARISVMSKIFGPVMLIAPLMLAALDETNISFEIGAISFFLGLFLIILIFILERPEFLSVNLDQIDGLNFYLDFYGFKYLFKKEKIERIIDLGIKCDFESVRTHATSHSLIFLFDDGSTFKICLSYSLSQSPHNDLLRLARFAGEIADIKQQPALLGKGNPEIQTNPQTGLPCFKGVRFTPK